MPNIMLPLIRKVVPSLIAQDIVGVQPMTGPTGSVFNVKHTWMDAYTVITHEYFNIPEGYVVVEVNREISTWIESMAIHMWKPADGTRLRSCYTISGPLYTMLVLKYSA